MKSFARYLLRNLIAIDQLANALFGGDEDQTISGAVGAWNLEYIYFAGVGDRRWQRHFWRFAEMAINALFDFLEGQRHHCRRAIEYDRLDPEQRERIWLLSQPYRRMATPRQIARA